MRRTATTHLCLLQLLLLLQCCCQQVRLLPWRQAQNACYCCLKLLLQVCKPDRGCLPLLLI
jgi:hypothetical protein